MISARLPSTRRGAGPGRRVWARLLAACLALAWPLLSHLARADDEPTDVQGVTGTVVADGVGTQAELELFRIGDFDPLYGTRRYVVRDLDALADRFALDWGAVPDGDGRRLRTDAQGRFSLGALEAGGYALWARDAGGRLGGQTWEVHVSGARDSLEISLLTDKHTLKARVLRGDTEPHVGPVVILRCFGEGSCTHAVGRARTDAEGRLSVPGLPTGEVQLVAVTSDGVAAVSPRHRVPRGGEFTWVLAPPDAQVVRGRVLAPEGDAPLEGATVEAVSWGPGERRYTRSARAGSQGRFEIPLPPGKFGLMGYARGFEGGGPTRPVTGGEEVEVRLKRQHVIRGRVVKKGTAEGLQGVRVFAYMLDLGGRRRYATQTDEQGRFELRGMTATDWMVFALGHGWVSEGLWGVGWKTYNPFTLALGESPALERTLEVVPAGTLEGVVVDDAGHPVPGVLVRPELRSTPASDERPLWAYGTAPEVLSGPDGTFRHVGLLPKGMYTFNVDTPGFPETVSAPLVVRPGPQGQGLALVLSRKRWIRVRVTDAETGKPVPGARIEPALLGYWGPRPLYWSRTTSEDGVTRLGPLPEGPFGIYVDAAAYEHPEDAALPVPASFVGADAEPFPVALRPGLTITGRARLPEGRSASEFKAHAFDPRRREVHPSPVRTVPLAEDGSFRLTGLHATPYNVSVVGEVEGGVWAGRVKAVVPTADVSVLLAFHAAESPFVPAEPRERTGPRERGVPDRKPTPDAATTSASFRVLTPEGAGLRGARVAVLPVRPDQPGTPSPNDFAFSHAEAYTDAEGRCTIPGLRPEGCVVGWAVSPEFIAPDPLRFTPSADEVTLTLRRGHAVDVRLLDDQGKPFVGAAVQARRLEGEGDKEHWELKSMAYAGRDGLAHLEGLDPQQLYRLAVYPWSDLRMDWKEIEIYDWKPADTGVRMERK